MMAGKFRSDPGHPSGGVSEDRFELIKVKRLDEVMVESGLKRLAAVVVLPIAGNRHEDQIATGGRLAEAASHLVTIHPRQPNIEQDDIGLLLLGSIERSDAAVSHLRCVPREPDQEGKCFGRRDVVVHNEDLFGMTAQGGA